MTALAITIGETASNDGVAPPIGATLIRSGPFPMLIEARTVSAMAGNASWTVAPGSTGSSSGNVVVNQPTDRDRSSGRNVFGFP
jgi:hypothetical protein